MGSVISNTFRRLFGNNQIINVNRIQVRVIMGGIDSAGKTTILYRLKLGETVNTISTIGINTETIEYKKIKFTFWDSNTNERLRQLFRLYFKNAFAIIFVVDSNDRERIGEVRDYLKGMLDEDDLKDALLLVFANKQDLPNAMSTSEITDKLGLKSLQKRTWYIQKSCATNGHGLNEGFDWLWNQKTNSSIV